MRFWVHILRCSDGSYYTGHTDDLEKRIAEHEAGEWAVYTSTRLPVRLVFSQEFSSRNEALACERQIKGWSRKKKEAMMREIGVRCLGWPGEALQQAQGERNKTGRFKRIAMVHLVSFPRIAALLTGTLFLFVDASVAYSEEIIFLQDGRTIRAQRTEIIGDRVRIEKPAETIEIPRSDVLSIHPVTQPTASPNVPPPAEVYGDMTQQMTDKVRREIQDRPGTSRTR